jgi:glutamine synthetase
MSKTATTSPRIVDIALLSLPYAELERRNRALIKLRDEKDSVYWEEFARTSIQKEEGITNIILCFSDIEGKLHTITYDKEFLLDSADNLTFDGSSIRGFTKQSESDLRLSVDWSSMLYVPADIFGPGKILFFANIHTRDRKTYASDFRGVFQEYTAALKKKQGITMQASAEIEGFLFSGVDAEQRCITDSFDLVAQGGYYRDLPGDSIRTFIDTTSRALHAMGFRIEKNHPEVSPSQFEINFHFTNALRAADEILLYKYVCRQIARSMGMTASFLPKPIVGMNGNGMHTNISLSKAGKNLFWDPKGKDQLSSIAWEMISRILGHAESLCLILNSSVNAYRRLDPHYEAPNEIKVSAVDRGSMIRIPVANSTSARIEVRSVAPDANPYLVLYSLLRIGVEREFTASPSDSQAYLFGNLYDAIEAFEKSAIIPSLIGDDNAQKYAFWKKQSAYRCARELGTSVKAPEVAYHHEVTNQALWNAF